MALILGAVMIMLTAWSGTASADPTADEWYRVRVCESGNNYAINSGNGYYGAYQFNLSTWRGVGGSGYPHEASPAVQDALALTLWRQRGWSPWACARILGLTGGGGGSSAPARPAAPTGSLDVVQSSGNTAVVAGWVLDANASASSIQVHIYVNSAGYPFTADKPRPDVNAVLGVGGQHGFHDTVPLQPGSNNVCAFAIGVNSDNNALIGCRTVQGASLPTGNVELMSVAGWNVTVDGWAFDPNSPGSSNQVHLYVNQAGTPTVANIPRPDVNSAFGIPGQHGFSVTGRLNRGPNTVCAYSIVTGAGDNWQIQCRTVQGPVPPVGSLDVVAISGSQAFVAGWALDQNSPATSIPVHIYVNNAGYPFTASGARPDVNSVMGVNGLHGFAQWVPLTIGTNTVCAYAIGLAGGNNTLIQCRDITYNGVQPQSEQQLAAAPVATGQSVAPTADVAPSAVPEPALSPPVTTSGSPLPAPTTGEPSSNAETPTSAPASSMAPEGAVAGG